MNICSSMSLREEAPFESGEATGHAEINRKAWWRRHARERSSLPDIILRVSLLAFALGFSATTFPVASNAAPAQCESGQEPALRAAALQSDTLADTEKYLSCFPYGDGVVSVKQHQEALKEKQACAAAKNSDNAEQLRTFVLTYSGSACAPEIAKRLKQIQELNAFKATYENTNFVGTEGRKGTTDSELSCANACQAGRGSCAGYTFEGQQKICTIWSSIQNRVPRGGARSASFEPVSIAPMPAVSAPQPISPPAAAAPVGGEMGYLNNADMPGGDYQTIPNVALEQCDAICKQSSQCAAFTFNTKARVCFLKDAKSNPIPFAGAVSGMKTGRTSGAYSTPPAQSDTIYRIMEGMDLPNDDPQADFALLRDIPQEACENLCSANNRCVAFTYNHQRNACILKSSVRRSVMFQGATSGIKQ